MVDETARPMISGATPLPFGAWLRHTSWAAIAAPAPKARASAVRVGRTSRSPLPRLTVTTAISARVTPANATVFEVFALDEAERADGQRRRDQGGHW